MWPWKAIRWLGGPRAIKVVASLCFFLLALNLFLARASPARGYEISIYTSTPILFWLGILASLAVGITIVVYGAVGGAPGRSWTIGFSLLLASNFSLLLLPTLRGYFYYNPGDPLGNLGEAGGILRRGNLGAHMYPFFHVMLVQLSELTDLPLVALGRYVPALFSVFTIVYTFLLARVALPQRGAAIVVAAAAVPLLYGSHHATYYAHGLALLTLPLVFWLYFKVLQSNLPGFKIALVLLLLSYPMFYPVVALGIIAFLLVAETVRAVHQPAGSGLTNTFQRREALLHPLFIALMAFVTWVSAQITFEPVLNTVMSWLRAEATPRVSQIAPAVASLSHLSRAQVVEYLAKLYGDNLIFVGLSVVATLIVVRASLRRERHHGLLPLLVAMFLIGAPVHLLVLTSYGTFSFGRFANLNLSSWVMPVLVGFALYHLLASRRVLGGIIIASILILVTYMGVSKLYYSPYIFSQSLQVTHRDMAGAQWLSDRGIKSMQIASMGLNVEAAIDYVGGTWFPKRPAAFIVPPHLGYPEKQGLKDLFPQGGYLVMTESFRAASVDPVLSKAMVVSSLILAQPGFAPRDFARVREDITASQVYGSGEVEVFYVHP